MVREFVVSPGWEQDFALVFGPGGMWRDLLRWCSGGYAGTELLALDLEAQAARRYQVRDWWSSHWEFEACRAQHHVEVEQFRDWLVSKGMVEHSRFLGAFYSDPPGDEDAGLVQA